MERKNGKKQKDPVRFHQIQKTDVKEKETRK